MPLTYTNRRGKLFYLHSGTTKTGKEKFYLSQKASGRLAEAVPEGFEIYENPNAGVYLRKKLHSQVRKKELETVSNGIEKYSTLRPHEYKLELTKDKVTVYVLDEGIDELTSMFADFLIGRKIDPADMARRHGTYTAMMCFCLLDEEKRKYEPQRYCFRGGVDTWISIGPPGKLESLVKRFVKHLGKESFYDILPY